jgi:hypothetical protein
MRIGLVLAAIVGLPVLAFYCSDDHQRFVRFDEQRDAWHRRCDVYVGKTVDSPAARACAEELAALTTYARKQGWSR